VFRCSGELTGQEMLDATRRLMTNPEQARRLDSGLISLVDVTALRAGADDIRTLVELDRQLATLIPRATVAFVAPRDHYFGMARMWEGLLNVPGWTSHVFRALGDAEAWLERQASTLRGNQSG
jgi:hypothetical protein